MPSQSLPAQPLPGAPHLEGCKVPVEVEHGGQLFSIRAEELQVESRVRLRALNGEVAQPPQLGGRGK